MVYYFDSANRCRGVLSSFRNVTSEVFVYFFFPFFPSGGVGRGGAGRLAFPYSQFHIVYNLTQNLLSCIF